MGRNESLIQWRWYSGFDALLLQLFRPFFYYTYTPTIIVTKWMDCNHLIVILCVCVYVLCVYICFHRLLLSNAIFVYILRSIDDKYHLFFLLVNIICIYGFNQGSFLPLNRHFFASAQNSRFQMKRVVLKRETTATKKQLKCSKFIFVELHLV